MRRRPIVYLVTFVVSTFLLVSFVVFSHQHQQVLSNLESSSLRIAIPNNGINTPNKGFVATLRKKKILVEVTTVGQFQYSLMEDLLDEVRDLCEAGATVSLHITTANCDPNPKPGDPECPLYERSHDSSTQENNYSVEKIDQLNERLRCRDTDGSLDASVHLVSPDWGKQVVDHHRRIFYDHIDEGFDLFVHTEEDVLIRPTSMLAFLQEMENLRELVGPRRLPDYSIGFIRYEKHASRTDRRRIVWEFDWENEIEVLNHPGIEGRYFSTPGWHHHQGMFMATPEQLLAWKNRPPNCKFDKPTRQYGYHRERISGALNIFDPEYCNVTQLVPLDSAEDFLLHHLSNKNPAHREPHFLSTMDLHKKRMKVLNRQNKKVWVDRNGKYNGIQMFVDEPDSQKFIPYNLDSYNHYVRRGGMLSDEEK